MPPSPALAASRPPSPSCASAPTDAVRPSSPASSTPPASPSIPTASSSSLPAPRVTSIASTPLVSSPSTLKAWAWPPARFRRRRQSLRRRPQRHHLQDRYPAPDLRPRHPRAQRRRISPRRATLPAPSSSPLPRSPPTTPSGPSTPHGETRVWYRGLGRPQGLALFKGRRCLPRCLPPWPPRAGARHCFGRSLPGRGRIKPRRRRLFAPRHHHPRHPRRRL